MSEVSTLPSSSYLNHSSAASTPEPSTSTDPAQLLRQAALSTRKLKRRKLDSSSPIITSLPRPSPRSIVSVPSIALDYGPEEPSSAASTEDRTPITTVQPPTTPTQSLAQTSPSLPDASSGATSRMSQSDDLSAREEGEISENEDPPFRPPPKSTSTPGVVYHTRADSPSFVHSPFGSRSPSVKAEDAYQHATPPLSASRRLSVEAASLPPKMQAPPLEPFRLETPLYVLDTHHVRPGLSLTQRQYDTAKEVILDILGYGVPPEYLIGCGLSREIIYYVFTELNLRLPNDFDIAGIPLYPPPPDVMASILLSQSSYPLPSASLDGSNVSDAGVRRSSEQPAFPHAPHDPGPSSQAPAPASQEGSSSAALLALSESTLAAMERQRKQELLARKAVQASRKRKEPMSLDATEPSTWPTTVTSTEADLSAKTSATAVSVEDFLNSIGPPLYDGADPKQDPTVENEPRDMEAYSPEPAGVIERDSLPDDDWSRPLVDRTSVPPSLEDASLPPSASASEANFFEREQLKWTNKTPRFLENLPARSRSDGTLAPPSRGDDGYDSRRSSSTPQPNAPTSRRGTKRPVAADFDSDPVPKAYTPPVLSRTGSGAGLNYGGGYYPNPHVRHKTNGVTAGGFASLNSTRRCVIDVSDSEDEASEDELSSAQLTPRDSALALEQEIERMRKMIREREELKLRKQVMASNRSTPVFREQQLGETRTSEETSETGPSPSTSATATATTRDEVPRSESCDDQFSENVLASAGALSLHSDVNDASQSPGPITSSPSPPGSTPLSFEDGSIGQVAVALLTSTDQSTTPAADDQTIGGPALAAESRQASASAASPKTSTARHIKETTPHWHDSEDGPEREIVDVLASVQVPSGSQVKTGSSFTAYNSVLSHYPFLSGRSLDAQEMDDRLNLKQLKIQAAARRLSENQLENARICQFEVPGGGECRDADCGDMHLSQLESEPKDDETAQYLCGDQNVAQMIQALQAARARRPEATFNERVNEAWESMRVQASLDSKT